MNIIRYFILLWLYCDFFTLTYVYWEHGYVYKSLPFATGRHAFSLRSWVLQDERKVCNTSVIAHYMLAKAFYQCETISV